MFVTIDVDISHDFRSAQPAKWLEMGQDKWNISAK